MCGSLGDNIGFVKFSRTFDKISEPKFRGDILVLVLLMVRVIERVVQLCGVLVPASFKGRNQFKSCLSWGSTTGPRNRGWVGVFGDCSNEHSRYKNENGRACRGGV